MTTGSTPSGPSLPGFTHLLVRLRRKVRPGGEALSMRRFAAVVLAALSTGVFGLPLKSAGADHCPVYSPPPTASPETATPVASTPAGDAQARVGMPSGGRRFAGATVGHTYLFADTDPSGEVRVYGFADQPLPPMGVIGDYYFVVTLGPGIQGNSCNDG